MITPTIFAGAKVLNLYVYNYMNTQLKYIKQKDLDLGRWDALVSASVDSNVFCYSWYLDAFCEWDAIVLGDYKGAIALPCKNRFFLNSLYQPSFIQKCVWFGTDLSIEEMQDLRLTLAGAFKLIHFNSNIVVGKTKKRTNLVLPLSQGILSIRGSYSKSLKRNLKKCSKSLRIVEDSKISDVISLYRQVWGKLNLQLTDQDYQSLLNLALQRPDNFICLTVKQEEQLLAGALLVNGKNRIHYILGASSKTGKSENALSFLLDSIMCKYASSDYIFDFEGSSIPSVKSFYEKFGSTNEPFYEIAMSSKAISLLKGFYKRLAKS